MLYLLSNPRDVPVDDLVTEEDIVRLTEIRIKKISKFDIDKAKQFIESL